MDLARLYRGEGPRCAEKLSYIEHCCAIVNIDITFCSSLGCAGASQRGAALAGCSSFLIVLVGLLIQVTHTHPTALLGRGVLNHTLLDCT